LISFLITDVTKYAMLISFLFIITVTHCSNVLDSSLNQGISLNKIIKIILWVTLSLKKNILDLRFIILKLIEYLLREFKSFLYYREMLSWFPLFGKHIMQKDHNLTNKYCTFSQCRVDPFNVLFFKMHLFEKLDQLKIEFSFHSFE